MQNAIAANVLGTTGAVCWSVQLIPQIIVTYRRHHTVGLQPTMMLLWATAGVPLGVYNITQNFNVALQIQPQILTFLSLVTWAQCRYYGDQDGSDDDHDDDNNNNDNIDDGHPTRWSFLRCCAAVMAIGALMGGVEVALIFALYQAVDRNLEWPGILMAVLAAVLLSAGVARHYWDIWKERTVRGISFLFVGIDALGDLTSLLSLVFQPKLDILGMVIYGSELVLWLGVFACGGWFNLRPWMKGLLSRWSKRGNAVPGQLDRQVEATHNPDAQRDRSDDGQSVTSVSSGSVFRTARSDEARHRSSSDRGSTRLRAMTRRV